MRAVLAAGAIALLLVATAAARDASAPSPLTDLHVVQVDVNAFGAYESQALRAKSLVMREHFIRQADAALQAASPAVKALTPPPELVTAAKDAGALVDATSFLTAWKRLVASTQKPTAKTHILIDGLDKAADEMRRGFCTGATAFRGPIMVNGVEATPPQITWRLSCPYSIGNAEFEIPGHTWGAVDAGGAGTKLLDGGRVLQVTGDGSSTTATVTAAASDVYQGAEGEVVVIHGDSASYQEEDIR